MKTRVLLTVLLVFTLCMCLMFVSCGDTSADGNESKTDTVTVTFDTSGGSEIDSVQVTKGEKVSKPDDPKRRGYTFDGWYVDGEEWSFVGYTVTKNLTITAKWIPVTYTITYAGEYINCITHTNKTSYTAEDKDFELNGETSEYYEFFGWYEDEKFKKPITKIEKGTTGNKTIYAKIEYIPVKFELNGDGYKVIGYDKKTANVVIPSTYKGKPVTSIGGGVFSDSTSLTSVTIPDSIMVIDSYAFYYCQNLTSITIPDSVTSIGFNAFACSYNLTSITLPFVGATLNGTENTHFGYIFGAPTYYSNEHYVPSNLQKVIITGGNSIGNGAFYNCTSLTRITIPDSVTSIGFNAFYNCTSLTRITIPDSVTSIGYNAFFNCNDLKIYCEAQSKPSGWHNNWNYSGATVVVWGQK